MNRAAKVLTVVVAAAAFSGIASAQPTQPSTSSGDSAKARTTKQAADFAAQEKQMQDESKTFTPPDRPEASATQLNKGKNAGKGMLEAEATLQTSPTRGKGSPPVNKNAKPADPMKNISKMTPAERAQLRKDVVEGAKP